VGPETTAIIIVPAFLAKQCGGLRDLRMKRNIIKVLSKVFRFP
jgi:hypothetical protein